MRLSIKKFFWTTLLLITMILITVSGVWASNIPNKVVGLTILIDFPELRSKVTKQEIEAMLNTQGYIGYGNNGSVRDYFYDISDGKFEYTNIVTDFYTAQHSRQWYNDNSSIDALVREALTELKNRSFDFSRLSTHTNGTVIALNVMYYGKRSSDETDKFWPKNSGLTPAYQVSEQIKVFSFQITDIGNIDLGVTPSIATFSHENGHLLFDWEDTHTDPGGLSAGGGVFDLMGRATINSTNPSPPNPYCRYLQGWGNFIDLTGIPVGTRITLTPNVNGTYIFRNPARPNDELFMIESIRKTGRRATMPGEGLLIWHIDRSGNRFYYQHTKEKHYKVSIEQADGIFGLENNIDWGEPGDFFRGGYKDRFDNNSTPNSKWWDGSSSDLAIINISSNGDQFTYSLQDTHAPSAPELYYTRRLNINQVELRWTVPYDLAGVTSYEVYDGTVKIATTTANTITISGLKLFQNHPFTIKAKDAAGNTSIASNAITVSIPLDSSHVPPAPSGLAIYQGGVTPSIANLTWNAPVNFPGTPVYEIYNGNDLISLGTTNNLYIAINGLTPNTTYNFAVRARDGNGYISFPSNTLTVTTPSDTLVPTTPTNFSIYMGVVNYTNTTLSWKKSNDNVGVVAYDIYNLGTKLCSVPANASSVYYYYLLNGLKPNTTYYLSVIARDAAGNNSNPSNGLNVQTPTDTEAPTPPSNLVLYMGGVTRTTINISWTASNDNAGIAGYDIRYNGKVKQVQANTTYDTLTGLDPDTTYNITVIAKDLAGITSWSSNTLTVITRDTTPPAAPTGLTYNYISQVPPHSINLKWNGSTDDVGVTTYLIYNYTTILATIPASSGPGPFYYSVPGLDGDTTYSFTIKAKDALGNISSPSNTLTLKINPDNTPPTKPVVNYDSSVINASNIYLVWNKSTDDVLVESYDIYNGGVKVGTNSSSKTNFTVTGLTPNTYYTFSVQARDSSGNVSTPTYYTVQTAYDTTPPSKPTGLQLQVMTWRGAPYSIILCWNAPSDDIGVVAYDVYMGTALVGTAPANNSTGLLTIDGLPAATTILYNVKARDAAGNTSAASNVVTITTP